MLWSVLRYQLAGDAYTPPIIGGSRGSMLSHVSVSRCELWGFRVLTLVIEIIALVLCPSLGYPATIFVKAGLLGDPFLHPTTEVRPRAEPRARSQHAASRIVNAQSS